MGSIIGLSASGGLSRKVNNTVKKDSFFDITGSRIQYIAINEHNAMF